MEKFIVAINVKNEKLTVLHVATLNQPISLDLVMVQLKQSYIISTKDYILQVTGR